MKVKVRGADQEMEVEGPLAVGDILMFTSTMAVVVGGEEGDTAEVLLVSTSATGVKTSKLFRGIEAVIEDMGVTEVESENDDS